MINIDIDLYRKRYNGQKSQAGKRGIEWHFTFDSWLAWWGDDIINRGPYKGQLVMARFNDVGPYHPDNVRKITCSENCSEANKGKIKTAEHNLKNSEARKGKPLKISTKIKMSKTRKGVLKTEETKQRMKDAWKIRKIAKQ